ncbi:MAG: aldehyde dehydrogenase [actinobacterium acAMD-5]|jgi:acyl-CoA reductase-like NAD-dependent aldehyde dehydrogenase|nr:MAG: aldehyde dehydrogenase [actinobacterium acAMD-5]
MNDSLDVKRTAKLYINGAFPRSESGRTFVVNDQNNKFLANVSKASRKDARDAVVAARSAFNKWSDASAYNRGQVIYRIAEILQGRSPQFIAELESAGVKKAAPHVLEAIDKIVWYAGFSDKISMVVGSANPVAGKFFNFSIPEPTGVVAVCVSNEPSLVNLVSQISAAIVSGNTVVVVVPENSSLIAVSLAEVLATSDVPAGVVNILTGDSAELAPWLASHLDVNAMDLSGISDKNLKTELEASAATNLKRILRTFPDGLSAIKTYVEIKTVWHPQGF